ncbi:hypothetical protein B9Z55_021057 [Caenorhabditis nigoni]|uniref:Lin-15A/B-like domain-containing protein n=2 Tax=Caenorhabditis nigoni TaxID=1611254 RepID=A0A2G5TQB3_9PELO|nr:hypothetical protein B9Z55_021057 [Caenorhabditis nigoni]
MSRKAKNFQMGEPVIKDEVIEEDFNVMFKNGEYVEVKQEEIEQNPFVENNNSEEFPEEIKLEPKKSDSEIENVSTEISALKCKICQKRMPRNSLKMIKSEDDMIVLTAIFDVEVFKEYIATYVCLSHIQAIIDDNEAILKFAGTPFEKCLRLFIAKNKRFIRVRTLQRGICKVCHKLKPLSESYTISSKNIRAVIMIGCILRGTHSVEQAKYYITNNNGSTCYSHRKESIDMIFEYLGISNIQEFFKCPRISMGGLVDIAKNFDSDFTVDQFSRAFHSLYMKKPKNAPSNS